MEKSIFICPVCGEDFMRSGKAYSCKNGHSFDISAKGYVNLLTPDRKNSACPGDNKMMVNARARFLEKGYYSHLAEALGEAAREYYAGGSVLDAGCGEGYYTRRVFGGLYDTGCNCGAAADISKAACAKAGRKLSEFKSPGDFPCFETAAASVFRLPLAAGSISLMTSVFAPVCNEEFLRVLAPGGVFIMAIPAPRHLMGLKEIVYDTPYENVTGDYAVPGFRFSEVRKISREIFIDDPEDIRCLFAMTPYYYKTGKEGHERVQRLDRLSDTAAFEVIVYRKI